MRIHMWAVWFSPLKTWKKEKVQVTQWNEMLGLYFTARGFISKNEKYNPE